VNCPECGTLASDEDLFCGQCGAILSVPGPEAPIGVSPVSVVYPPAPSAPVVPDSRARVAFILGIISVGSVLITCLPFFGLLGCLSPLVGLLAIVLGSVAKRDLRARGGPEADCRRAHQGVMLGIAGVGLYVVVMAVVVVLGLGMNWLGER